MNTSAQALLNPLFAIRFQLCALSLSWTGLKEVEENSALAELAGWWLAEEGKLGCCVCWNLVL